MRQALDVGYGGSEGPDSAADCTCLRRKTGSARERPNPDPPRATAQRPIVRAYARPPAVHSIGPHLGGAAKQCSNEPAGGLGTPQEHLQTNRLAAFLHALDHYAEPEEVTNALANACLRNLDNRRRQLD